MSLGALPVMASAGGSPPDKEREANVRLIGVKQAIP